jgi:hypothetical protein
MSIARCAASFPCAAFLLAIGGAVHAEEPAKKTETPPAETAATPAAQANGAATGQDQSAATPAEPISAAPATPPVMPTTVVRPAAQQGAATPGPALPLSLGRYGEIELGRPPQAKSRWHGFPISLSLRDAPLPEVLRSFARIAGVNLVLSPGVAGDVTVELKDVPWDQALWVILKTHDMAAEIDGNVWSVEPY